MKNNDGKYFERLVEIFESSIDNDATIERDVKLPILNSKNGYRTQCDIVITKGKPPRITKTIIEVQDRGSKVKPNDFRGWIEKMNDVGAQHLICVSRQDFPKSIKEKASSSGNKISLVKITDHTELDKIPLTILNSKFYRTSSQITRWKLLKINIHKKFERPKKILKQFLNHEISSDQKIFTYDKNKLISINELAYSTIDKESNNTRGYGKFSHSLSMQKNLYLYHEKKFTPIGLEFSFDYIETSIEVPTSILSYEQDEFGVLVWLLKSVFEENKKLIEIKIPLKTNGKNLTLKSMYFDYSLKK